jgi:uncharacterized membrane protein
MTVQINKDHIFYGTVIIVAIILAAYFNGHIGIGVNIMYRHDSIPSVVQLDKTEYEIYKYAIENVEGDDLAEKKQSLNRLLGMISYKSQIIKDYPNERVEVLP